MGRPATRASTCRSELARAQAGATANVVAMATLMVVGGGKMGAALAGGLIGAKWAAADDLHIVEPHEPRRRELENMLPGVTVADFAVDADGVVLAVKPGDVVAAAESLADVTVGRVLSIAAGVTLSTLEAALPDGVPVIRAMPNTPSLVGLGASAISGGRAASDDDLGWAESIMSAVGKVAVVPEASLDAVTGLSGSGPAYVFMVAEALIEAGVLNGLPRPTATELVVQTLLGSATLLAESDDGPEALRAAVTSPGGTTAAGLRALEDRGVRAAFLEAVTAATARSKELGSS